MAQFRVEINESVDAQKWDALVSQTNWGTVGQTTFWAERLVALWNCKPYFYTVFSSTDVPVLLLVGFNITSYLSRDQPGQFIDRLKDHGKRVLRRGNRFQWFGQPVLLDHGLSGEAYKFLFSEVQRFCDGNKIHVLAPSELPELANASIPENWVKKKWGTYIVDLRQDVDSLWNNLKKSARKAIRTAREDGITVRRMRSLDELRAYYDFVRRCSPRYGKEAYGFADWERLWRLFRPTGVFETFLAEKSDKPLAGLSVWGYGGNISEFGSYQSEESFREKLYGSDLIKWEVISWGVRNGQRTFDLAGVNPEPQSPKEQGIRQFKEKWGGRYQEYVVVSWNRKE